MSKNATLLSVGLALVGLACGRDRDRDEPDDDAGLDAAAPVPDGEAALDAGADASDPVPPEGLRIEFDYRFDTAGFFDDPARRRLIEAAAAVWGAVLADDFDAIPAGTEVRTRDPEHPDQQGLSFPIEEEIDDVLVFVGCAPQADSTAMSNNAAAIEAVVDPVLREVLRARYEGADFEPWTGWISFDCDHEFFVDDSPGTDDDIPAAATDMLSTTLHELGHVLGFGASEAFLALVDDENHFTGPLAMAEVGGPVPLSPDGCHLDSQLVSDGRSTLMDTSRTVGTRTPPTSLDAACLGDLGYPLSP